MTRLILQVHPGVRRVVIAVRFKAKLVIKASGLSY